MTAFDKLADEEQLELSSVLVGQGWLAGFRQIARSYPLKTVILRKTCADMTGELDFPCTNCSYPRHLGLKNGPFKKNINF